MVFDVRTLVPPLISTSLVYQKKQPELTQFGTSAVSGAEEGQDSACDCHGMRRFAIWVF